MPSPDDRERELAELKAALGVYQWFPPGVKRAIARALALAETNTGNPPPDPSAPVLVPDGLSAEDRWRQCQNPACKSIHVVVGTPRPGGKVRLRCKACGTPRTVADFPGRKVHARKPRKSV